MQTVYVLLPKELAESLARKNDIFPEDVPDPWSGSDNAIPIPRGMCLVYKDDLAAKSDCQLAQAMLNIHLSIVQLSVPEGRIVEINEMIPDPSARFLTSGVRYEDYVSILQS